MTRIGILSDTHLSSCTAEFSTTASALFADCDIIVHAGDLTDLSVLRVFTNKQVYSVAGNMCNALTQRSLPGSCSFVVDGYIFGLCHGAGPRHNIEERMFELFPEAHCIIFGHTHQALCRLFGSTLMVNPGSFMNTGRYGAPGTYGIITVSQQGLQGTIHEIDHNR